jgi:hypothetical protein
MINLPSATLAVSMKKDGGISQSIILGIRKMPTMDVAEKDAEHYGGI